MSFIAAISQDRIISSQLIEGAVDSVLFENFLYYTLRSVRVNPATADKTVILLMDNAVIHKHSIVLETARKMKVNVLFNAEYSPWLNPIEQLFGAVKSKIRKQEMNTT